MTKQNHFKQKTILFLGLAFLATMALNAQNIIWEEDFEGTTFYFNENKDADGDGNKWQFGPLDGSQNNVAYSYSFSPSGPLAPDNWLIAVLDLSEVGNNETLTLTWDVTTVELPFADEEYSVYVATGYYYTGDLNVLLGSTTSFSELVSNNGPGGLGNFYTKTLDISSFAGEQELVSIAFRHHGAVTGMSGLVLDNVSVSASGLGMDKAQVSSFKYFYNPESHTLTLSAGQWNSQITLYNLLGHQVISKKLASAHETLNLSSLKTGIYLANVEVDGKAETFKIVKR